MDKSSAWLTFADIADKVDSRAGFYEIRFMSQDLKVGVSSNLRKRLKQHAQSLQKRLKSSAPEPWSSPDIVKSKASILAKHLYFDRSIAPQYDLRTELGRQRFLSDKCRVRITVTATREDARELEKLREARGKLRYVGRVQVR